MNFLNIIRKLFPTQPTLDEYINAHTPQTVEEVEYLQKQYEYMMKSGIFSGDDGAST